jgi:hypothetical protein
MFFLSCLRRILLIQFLRGSSHRGGKGRGETARMSLTSQLEHTPQLSSRGLLRIHLLLCPSKIFRHGNKNTLFLVMVYSALFDYVPIQSFILILKYISSTNSASWQWHWSALHTTEVLHRVLTWLGIGN